MINIVQASFPSRHLTELQYAEQLSNATCNVVAGPTLDVAEDPCSTCIEGLGLYIHGWASNNGFELFAGDKVITSTPLGMATRQDDREFSDVINWILQALFYGDEQGLTKSSSLCQNDRDLPRGMNASELNYMNAVYCVGR